MRHKAGIVGGVAAMLIAIAACGPTGPPPPAPVAANYAPPPVAAAPIVPTAPSSPVTTTHASHQPTPSGRSGSGGTYTDHAGVKVESPDANTAGASAKCKDGSFSHSQTRSGTCSHHGGVAQWL